MVANRALAKALAEAALVDAKIMKPPVDLDDLALARVLRIERHADLKPPLRATYSPDRGLVRVVSLPPTVERFPIAHELGHAILDDGGAACTEAMIHKVLDAASLADIVESFDP